MTSPRLRDWPVALLLASILMASIAGGARAESCMRLVDSGRHAPQGTDGPGSFGPLQDTLTLGCLRFSRIEGPPDRPTAVLLDEAGRQHSVEVGSYVGENTGRITSITARKIRIVQLVPGEDGEYAEVVRFLFRDSGE